jgi:hypothetical protein
MQGTVLIQAKSICGLVADDATEDKFPAACLNGY